MKKTTIQLTLYGDGISGLLKYLFKLEEEMPQLETVETTREEV